MSSGCSFLVRNPLRASSASGSQYSTPGNGAWGCSSDLRSCSAVVAVAADAAVQVVVGLALSLLPLLVLVLVLLVLLVVLVVLLSTLLGLPPLSQSSTR